MGISVREERKETPIGPIGVQALLLHPATILLHSRRSAFFSNH